ncbi:hypothetical protein BDZ94DRAFT_1379300 [Collybia nuda]|uniref:Uncharacterized protein n=1 Tax=Collybia nuda TaxID=64659 RepID=A0A9P6CIF8_9AGAR|nr:hypothetical protein BDZ94DRAFT_1379300 [Collybia nuda]
MPPSRSGSRFDSRSEFEAMVKDYLSSRLGIGRSIGTGGFSQFSGSGLGLPPHSAHSPGTMPPPTRVPGPKSSRSKFPSRHKSRDPASPLTQPKVPSTSKRHPPQNSALDQLPIDHRLRAMKLSTEMNPTTQDQAQHPVTHLEEEIMLMGALHGGARYAGARAGVAGREVKSVYEGLGAQGAKLPSQETNKPWVRRRPLQVPESLSHSPPATPERVFAKMESMAKSWNFKATSANDGDDDDMYAEPLSPVVSYSLPTSGSATPVGLFAPISVDHLPTSVQPRHSPVLEALIGLPQLTPGDQMSL